MPNHALAFYEQAAALVPTDAAPYFFLGVTLRGKGLHQQAVDMYDKALAIRPHYPDCLFNIGNIYFECLQDLAKAEQYYKEALNSLRLEENDDEIKSKSIINKGRVCNLLAEVSKQRSEFVPTVTFYLEGIREDTFFLDNYADLADSLRKNKLDELAVVAEHLGRVVSDEAGRTSYEEDTAISQAEKVIELNLARNVYIGETGKVLRDVYQTVDSLVQNALLSEYQLAVLRQLLQQLNAVNKAEVGTAI